MMILKRGEKSVSNLKPSYRSLWIWEVPQSVGWLAHLRCTRLAGQEADSGFVHLGLNLGSDTEVIKPLCASHVYGKKNENKNGGAGDKTHLTRVAVQIKVMHAKCLQCLKQE